MKQDPAREEGNLIKFYLGNVIHIVAIRAAELDSAIEVTLSKGGD